MNSELVLKVMKLHVYLPKMWVKVLTLTGYTCVHSIFSAQKIPNIFLNRLSLATCHHQIGLLRPFLSTSRSYNFRTGINNFKTLCSLPKIRVKMLTLRGRGRGGGGRVCLTLRGRGWGGGGNAAQTSHPDQNHETPSVPPVHRDG